MGLNEVGRKQRDLRMGMRDSAAGVDQWVEDPGRVREWRSWGTGRGELKSWKTALTKYRIQNLRYDRAAVTGNDKTTGMATAAWGCGSVR